MKRLISNTPFTKFEAMNLSVTNLYARLKEYENTGLEPEEVRKVLDSLTGTIAGEIAEVTGSADITRASEIAKAEAEGRLLILPCKVGDVVYFACASWIRGQPIVGTTSINPVSFDPTVMWDFNNNHFKRHYFLTREEAEAALRGSAD